MKTLFLSGSPRPGSNSRAALEAAAEGIGAHLPEMEIEFVDVPKLKLSGCIACDSCRRNGGRCVLPDGGDAFAEKVLAADVLIFGTPVYWWGIASQLKAAVDRLYCKGDALHACTKQLGVVAVGAADLDDPQYALIRGQFENIAAFLGWELIFCEGASAAACGELASNDAGLRPFRELWRRIRV